MAAKPMDPVAYGLAFADRLFRLRIPRGGPRRGMKNTEIHLREADLAQLLAMAYAVGRKAGR